MSKSIKNNYDANTKLYTCDNCDYTCSRIFLWKQHIASKKHICYLNDDNKNVDNTCLHCSKLYSSRQSLHRHKQTCKKNATFKNAKINDQKNDEINDQKNHKKNEDDIKYKDMFIKLLEENKELLKTIQELIPKIGNNNNNTTNNTNNNFNLNMFLNETCKDALNMMEFVKSMNLQLIDLEQTGKLGYSGGMSRIFINGLKELDINKRPIHCSDLKREILYIKEDNVWEKDNEERTRIKKAIREIEHKNIKQIPLFIKEHPNCVIGSNKENTPYLKMVMQCTGGIQNDEETNINKIITNIAKEVVINK
jgi:hypothetical protein